MSEFIHKNLDNFMMLHQLDKYMYGHSGFIAGGVFKNIFNNENFKDVDVYFESQKDWNDANEKFKDNKFYVKSYENEKVSAYKHKNTNIRVELIRTIFGKPEDIINQFDFTVTKFAYYKKTDDDSVSYKIVHHEDFFEHLHMKRLVIDNNLYKPASTFERTYRYNDYGYKLCRDSKIKLILALREGDFTAEDLSRSLYDGMD